MENKKLETICKHESYCNVRYFGRINCISESSVKTCQTAKYYERYGSEPLGIGAITIVPEEIGEEYLQ